MKRQNLKSWVVLFLAALQAPVQAATETFEVDGIYYSVISDEFVEVVAPTEGTKYSGDLIIPYFVAYKGKVYMFKGVGNGAFQGAQSLNSVKVPYFFMDYLTIGDYAFNDCSLTSFMINEFVNTIGEKAFYYCDKMKDLYVCAPDPASFKQIGSQAFSNINRGSNVCTLHVPTGSKQLYKDDGRFSDFTVIEEFEPPVVCTVFVRGTQVTAENAADILGDGAASYTPATKTLTLKKDIESPSSQIPNIMFMGRDPNDELNINVANDVTLDNVFGCNIFGSGYGTLTLSGPSKLSLSALMGGYAFMAEGIDFVFDHANIEINASTFIEGGGESTLTIKSSSLVGQVKRDQAAISGFCSVTLEGCEMVNPAGGRYDADSRKLLDAEGNVSPYINIQPTEVKENYDLKIAGVQVTNDNMRDITGDGAASYTPHTKTLIIKGDITAPAGTAAVYNMGVDGLTIQVEKDAVLSSSGSPVIYSMTSTTHLTGTAQLTLKAPDSMPISAFGNMTISNLQVVLSSCKYGIYGTGELILDGASIEGTVTDGAAFMNWTQFYRNDCSIVEPANGSYNTALRQLVDKEGNPSPTVKITGRDNPVLTFDKQVCKAKPGQPFTSPKLTAPNGIVTYSSSNPEVAIVSGTGKVNIIGEGVAVITATYHANSTYNAGTAQYCIVSQESDAFFYDVNGDSKVTITDAVSVVDAILSGVE